MRSIVELFVHFVMAITGALGVAIAWVGGLALLGAFGVVGGGWFWRSRKHRGKNRP